MEIQFDNIAADRTIILRCLYQLHNSLSDRKILTWDFFHSRFEICATETQLKYKSMDRPFFKGDVLKKNRDSLVRAEKYLFYIKFLCTKCFLNFLNYKEEDNEIIMCINDRHKGTLLCSGGLETRNKSA